MYKSRLQELCQRRRWELPVYQFSKEGPDHAPRFQATVIVEDCSFSTHSFFSSSKKAQNAAAKLAVNYLSHFQLPSLSSPPLSTSTSTPDRLIQNIPEIRNDDGLQLLILRQNDENERDETIYKNLLQELVQKYRYPLPIYNTKKFGELHSPVFISIVEVKGHIFRGLEARTKKQAEMSAAKIAYTSLR